MIVSSCQHCDEQQFQTLMCTLLDFFSSKIRFIHRRTDTGSHYCSIKKTMRTPRVHLVDYKNSQTLQYGNIFLSKSTWCLQRITNVIHATNYIHALRSSTCVALFLECLSSLQKARVCLKSQEFILIKHS